MSAVSLLVPYSSLLMLMSMSHSQTEGSGRRTLLYTCITTFAAVSKYLSLSTGCGRQTFLLY